MMNKPGNWTEEELNLKQQAEQDYTVVCNSRKIKSRHINLMQWAKENGKFTYKGRQISYHKEYTAASKWCNKPPQELKQDNAAAVDCFINEIYNKRPDLQEAIQELKGQVLGCWCKPNVCHGDFLADQTNKRMLNAWLKGGQANKN